MYNKEKALQTLKNIFQEDTNENIRDAISDLEYALSIALVAYTEHLMHWVDIPEHSNQDTRDYFAALHNIHKTLVEACVFDELE